MQSQANMFSGLRVSTGFRARDNAAVISPRGENLELFGIPEIKALPLPSDSCDASALVVAADGMQYLVKTNDYWPSLPLCEHLCHQIFEACDVEMLPYREIALQNGMSGFGSRYLPNVFVFGNVLNTPDQLISRLTNQQALRATIVLDLFLFNDDRHWNNLIFAPDSKDGDKVKVYPIDFSRALFYNAFPPPDVSRMAETSHTLVTARFIAERIGLTVKDTEPVLKALRRISPERVAAMIQRVPPEWLVGFKTNRLTDWWSSEDRLKRIDRIMEAIANGELTRLRRP